MSFAIDARLAADTAALGDWPLCRVLAMRDARYPWLVLVPRREGALELTDLPVADRAALIEEIVRAVDALKATTRADKINVGALGNVVAQLHIHVVARRRDDFAWPGPVWGNGASELYAPEAWSAFTRAMAARLGVSPSSGPGCA